MSIAVHEAGSGTTEAAEPVPKNPAVAPGA